MKKKVKRRAGIESRRCRRAAPADSRRVIRALFAVAECEAATTLKSKISR
jgi:hypothetical protein